MISERDFYRRGVASIKPEIIIGGNFSTRRFAVEVFRGTNPTFLPRRAIHIWRVSVTHRGGKSGESSLARLPGLSACLGFRVWGVGFTA